VELPVVTRLWSLNAAHKLHKTSPYKEQIIVSPVEAANETVTMDTPPHQTSEAITSLVTVETGLSYDGEYTKGNFKDYSVVISERSSCELVAVKCDECGKDIPLDVWIEHEDYHAATEIF